MLSRLKPLILPAVVIVLAAAVYKTRIEREMADFAVYRTAAVRVMSAEPLYRSSDGHYQFKYLPAFALAMTPLALVDANAAKAIWFAFSVGLLAAFVRWSVRALPERRRSARLLVWLAMIFMAKFYAHELTLGQTNLLLGAILVAALLAAQIDMPLLAGGLIGLAAFVKPYALIFLPWLAVAHGFAAAGVAVAVVGAGLLLPMVTYGWTGNLDQLAGWYRAVTTSTQPNLIGADNISLAAMWAKWIGPGRQASTLATVSGGLALALAGVAWARRRLVETPDYLEFALLMLLVPLLSPQGWDYVLLLATPAVVCLVDRFTEMAGAWRVATAIALVLTSFTIFDLMGRALYGQFMALSIVSVAAMGLAAALAHVRWRALA